MDAGGRKITVTRVVWSYTPPGVVSPPYLSILDVDGMLSITVRGEEPLGACLPPHSTVLLPDAVWRECAIALNNEMRRRMQTFPTVKKGDKT